MRTMPRGTGVDFELASLRVEAKSGGLGSSVVLGHPQVVALGDHGRLVIVAYQRSLMRRAAASEDVEEVRALVAGAVRWAADLSALAVRVALRDAFERGDQAYWPLTQVRALVSRGSRPRVLPHVHPKLPSPWGRIVVADLHVWVPDSSEEVDASDDDSGFDVESFGA